MKYIRRSTQFKKDYKRIKRADHNLTKLQNVITQLAHGEPLAPIYRDHALFGNYQNCRECHIESDWLLMYKSSTTELAGQVHIPNCFN